MRRQLATSFASLTGGASLADRRAAAARLRGGEEHRLDQVEVALLAHALHEHRADHAAPADDAYLHLCIVAVGGWLLVVAWSGNSQTDYQLTSYERICFAIVCSCRLDVPS